MVKIAKLRDDRPGIWLVETEQGAQYYIKVDQVHASNRAFWAWPQYLIAVTHA